MNKFKSLMIVLILIICSCFSLPYNAEAITDINTINNLVVFVRFQDSSEFVNANYIEKMDKAHNLDEFSVKNYFAEISENKVSLSTTFAKSKVAKKVASVQLENKRNYYVPKSASNKIGYETTKTGDEHIDSFYREQMMLREAIDKIEVDESLDLDNNNDGFVDSLTFIIEGESGAWQDLLWPHMFSFWDFESIPSNLYSPSNYFLKNKAPVGIPKINGVYCGNYDFLLNNFLFRNANGTVSDYPDVGTICHELMHVLGASDLYHYKNKDTDPVGDFCVMSTTNNRPQYPLSYMRYKMGFLTDENILTISQSGTYNLSAVNQDKKIKALKIVTDNKSGEYFMLEVREKTGFDEELSVAGLIAYRIDKSASQIDEEGLIDTTFDYGNMYGAPDEVKILNNLKPIPLNRTFDDFLYQGRNAGNRKNYKNKNSGISILAKKSILGEYEIEITLPEIEADILAPKMDIFTNISSTSKSLDVTYSADETSDIGLIVVEKGSVAPNLEQILSGVDYSGVVVLGKDKKTNLFSRYAATSSFEFEKSNLDVDIYFLIIDKAGHSFIEKRNVQINSGSDKIFMDNLVAVACNIMGMMGVMNKSLFVFGGSILTVFLLRRK